LFRFTAQGLAPGVCGRDGGAGDGGGSGVGRRRYRSSVGEQVTAGEPAVGVGGGETVSARINLLGNDFSMSSSDSWCGRSRHGGGGGYNPVRSPGGVASDESSVVWGDGPVTAAQVVIRWSVAV